MLHNKVDVEYNFKFNLWICLAKRNSYISWILIEKLYILYFLIFNVNLFKKCMVMPKPDITYSDDEILVFGRRGWLTTCLISFVDYFLDTGNDGLKDLLFLNCMNI